MSSTLRSDQIIYFGTSNTPQIPCRFHEDYIIQNFCKKQDCSLPMCPECIKIHQEEHEQERVTSDIDLFSNCLTEQYNKSLEYLNLWAIDVQESSNLQEEVQKAQEFQLQRFQEAKKQFYKVIDDYFRIFESTIANETQKSTQDLIKLVRSRHRIEYLEWKTLHENLQKLNSDKCLPPLIQIYSDPRQSPQAIYLKNHQEHVEQLNKLKLNIRQVVVNDNLNQILTLLKQYIYITAPVQDSQIQQVQITNTVQPILQTQQIVQAQPIVQNQAVVQTQSIANQAINQNKYQSRVIQPFSAIREYTPLQPVLYQQTPMVPIEPLQIYPQQFYHPHPVLQEPMVMPVLTGQQSTPPQIIRSPVKNLQPVLEAGSLNGQLRETMAQRYYDQMLKNEIK
ncbi:unnamed protein product [Paramecium octaurelia]|uniref:Uncharacterized protein n=1 Tax=Paramecium octaurelia TaxID=43137 RepID=A0A8S1SIJ4_PAROT|nr:unnamed protein product [Paramecium octaurelia]